MNNWKVDDEENIGGGNLFFDCKYRRNSKEDYRYEGKCPVPKSIMSDGTWDDPEKGYESWEITYSLRDKAGFEEALVTDLGMQPDWILWEDWDSYPECEGQPGDCVEVHQWLRNFPRKADEITVGDPKKVLEEALPHIDELRNQFLSAVLGVGLATYDPERDWNDAAVALAVPVQLLAQAVDNMANVKELGGEIEEQKKKETILFLVSLVLLVVPFVSEIGLELAGFVSLARFAFIGGEIGNGALTIAEVIDDPESAPVAIMGLLTGAAGRGKRTEDIMSDAAAARLKMKAADVAGIGKTFKAIDDKVQKVVTRCIK